MRQETPDLQERRRDNLARWIVPLAIIAFAVAAIVLSLFFDRMPPILKRGIQPSDFPQLVAGLIIVLALLSMVFEPVRFLEKVSLTTIMTIAVLPVFALVVAADFFLALGVSAALLAAFWGERRPVVLLFVGIILPTIVFFFFDLVFEIRFPRGILTNIWYG